MDKQDSKPDVVAVVAWSVPYPPHQMQQSRP